MSRRYYKIIAAKSITNRFSLLNEIKLMIEDNNSKISSQLQSEGHYDEANISEDSENMRGELVQRKWQWATPLVEGVPPCPRGGHTATKTGGCIIVFGGHYYGGKDKGFVYLNDTYVLDIDNNKWIVKTSNIFVYKLEA